MIGTIAGTPLGDEMGLQRKGWRMLDLVAKYATMWNCPTVADPALIPDIQAMVDEACDRNGRPRESLDRSNGITVNLPGWQDHFGMTSVRKRRARSGVFNGDYAEIAAYIRQYADLGVDELHIQIDPENPQGMEQFGRVIEELRK